jgi:CubicO group peptidase (beta-lactamase class C family)
MAPQGFDRVTIRHLLQMTAGLKFNESYTTPFSGAPSFYYGRHLRKRTLNLRLKQEPGKSYEYTSGTTQLLGLVLERALKGKTITAYLQEKIWTPMQTEYPASWSIDQKKDGLEKTFCCINATAVDYAKFGRLYGHQGTWNGKQVVPASWVKESTRPDTTDGAVRYYKYQWWIPSPQGDFCAQGHLGQYIYVYPKKDIVIVRLGKNVGGVPWVPLIRSIAAGL